MPFQVLDTNGNILTGSSPGGSDTQVQFNDAGTFGGDAGLTYNKTTDALTIAGDLAVNGGDLTSSTATFNLLNATVTTLNIGGAATTVAMGAGAASTLNANFTTAINLNTAAIVSSQTTVALLNTTTTTVNAFGAATVIALGAASTVITLGSNATINGGAAANDDLTLQGTSHATKTTSYVILQPTGGNVGIGTTGPGAKLDVRDGNIILTDADVAHGLTTRGTTESYGILTSASGTAGGLFIEGLSDAVDGEGLYLSGVIGSSDPTDTVAALALRGSKSNGTTGVAALGSLETVLQLSNLSTPLMTVLGSGNVGIGTVVPGNPLAVNRSADGVIVDFESGDTVQGNVSIAGATTSYNAFVGSHYTQLKAGQAELPVGAVVISTGEIVPCQAQKATETPAMAKDAVTVVDKANAIEQYQAEVEDKSVIISTETTYDYDPETDSEKEIIKTTYGTKTETRWRLKGGVKFHKMTRNFYRVKAGYVEKENGFYQTGEQAINMSGKEYFPYIDTTSTPADKRVYGVWFSKMSGDSKGQAFGQDDKPVYLITQVGLFKARVTDTAGNIAIGDYLETSSRPMEAQKQTAVGRRNSTLAKALVDVNWSTVQVDPALGYKWKLIPAIF